jgi:acetyltransferase
MTMAYTIEHYPTRLIDVWTLADGRRVTVRPVLPQDAALEQALVRALSPAARHQRFFVPIRELPEDWLRELTQIDYRRHQALIAECFAGDEALPAAEARYIVDADGDEAEFAVVVADDWQRLGLARRLIGSLIAQATRSGLKRLRGDVLATNRPMLELAQGLGFRARRHPDGGAQVLHIVRDLAAPVPLAPRAAGMRASPTAPAAPAAA